MRAEAHTEQEGGKIPYTLYYGLGEESPKLGTKIDVGGGRLVLLEWATSSSGDVAYGSYFRGIEDLNY